MSKELEEVKRITERLHALKKIGRGDGPGAERLQEERESLRKSLTEEERKELEDL